MTKFIESHHEVPISRRIADVRPWSERTQEWLSKPSNFLFVAGPTVYLCAAAPVLLPLVAPAFLLAHWSVMSLKNALPYRYPASNGTVDPEGKKGDGILLIGDVRSDSPFEKFKQCWLSDDDLRKHWLILGSTGSGKSETLKGIFYNALCWGSGFFAADGKADNKLPADGYTMARAFGRDDSFLVLNFLLGGKTPQQVARSRRRRTNKINPFSGADADTIIQMGANLLPKAEGDGKAWQEKALALWRAVITALCYKRDTQGTALSVGMIIDYLALPKIEELYLEGYDEAQERADQSWSYGYVGIKNYLDSGCPAYQVEKLLKKHNRIVDPAAGPAGPARAGGRPPTNDQDNVAYEQHAYRTGQLMPVLNLLDKTYGYIFRSAFSEIDMVDVALHNRILFLLIPSLEKSSQEAENLGKLTIACLRVMMAKNLGSELEGTREELLDSKATNAPYPYIAALDELGYYFADGIAVMFAQARSLGLSLMAATQDLEKLTEGSRAAEAGAMLGNTVNKLFMKIDDPKKTWELVREIVGKAYVSVYNRFEQVGQNFRREENASITEVERVSFKEMQTMTPGQGVMNALGVTQRISSFYMGGWLNKLNNQKFHINRFLQVAPSTDEDVAALCMPIRTTSTGGSIDVHQRMLDYLRYVRQVPPLSHVASATSEPVLPLFQTLGKVARALDTVDKGIAPMERGIVLYLAAKRALGLGGTFPDGYAAPGLPGAEPTGAAQSADDAISQGELLGEGHSAVTPAPVTHFAAVLATEGTFDTVSGVLDEHGLPDPLALMRRPVSEVLGPPPVARVREEFVFAPPPPLQFDEEDEVHPAPAAGGASGWPSGLDDLLDPADMTADQQLDAILDSEASESLRQPPGSPRWIADSVLAAQGMAHHPRSADATVVGLSDEAMSELVNVEAELGSPTPAASAHTMQQILAAQVTPNTIGHGELTVEQLDEFFARFAPPADDEPTAST
ncbi:TraM recognition domain-containing protein [Cupriavidus sp. TMH.W2]|uniref:TraM recognition domain-containing protein n=1 Tax=Cupriavidus sp. TMH.W2 TaxID=3434465 RepID=UPI003D773CBA